MKQVGWMGLATLLLVGVVWAKDETSRTVYVQVRDARIFHRPNPRSDVIRVLQPGAKLQWKGPVPGAVLPWQKVVLGRRSNRLGYIIGSNLSLTKPELKLKVSDPKGRGAAAKMRYADSSGDAVKALTPGSKAFATQKLSADTAAKDLERIFALSSSVTSAKVRAHAVAVGLPSVAPTSSRKGRR